MMRAGKLSYALITAVSIITVVLIAGCSIRQSPSSEDAEQTSRTSVAVLVDSSIHVAISGAPDAVSVPENAQIAVAMLVAAEDALARKGYTVSGPSLMSVGAWYAPSDKVRVRTTSGVLDSPGAIGKPFIIRPEPGDPSGGAIMNEVFHWSRKTQDTAPTKLANLAKAPRLLLVSCAGGNKTALLQKSEVGVSITSFKPGSLPDADAWSELTLLLLDRKTGKSIWSERSTVSAFTPESVAKEVVRLVDQLPAAN